mmetsp:Transcript_4914/g.18235  ORF Transcript_4914/g.18235 Transcript_4914/m.18235 type:complete len:257 (-) Transcript_4914:353-1123(-)
MFAERFREGPGFQPGVRRTCDVNERVHHVPQRFRIHVQIRALPPVQRPRPRPLVKHVPRFLVHLSCRVRLCDCFIAGFRFNRGLADGRAHVLPRREQRRRRDAVPVLPHAFVQHAVVQLYAGRGADIQPPIRSPVFRRDLFHSLPAHQIRLRAPNQAPRAFGQRREARFARVAPRFLPLRKQIRQLVPIRQRRELHNGPVFRQRLHKAVQRSYPRGYQIRRGVVLQNQRVLPAVVVRAKDGLHVGQRAPESGEVGA